SPFWQGVGRWSARLAHAADRVWLELRSLGGWIARTLAATRERRRAAVEERERSARINFERTFFQTSPLPGIVARQGSFAEPGRRSSKLAAAIELMLLIAGSGGVVAGAIFGVSHVLAHALVHFRPGTPAARAG